MNCLIQYQTPSNAWSAWTPATISVNQRGQVESITIIENGTETQLDVTNSFFRALQQSDRENLKVCWFVIHENKFYFIEKSKTDYIEKATLINHPKQSIPISEITLGDFSNAAFNDMVESAKAHCQPPFLTEAEVKDLLLRPADELTAMQLVGNTNPEQKTKNWWKQLFEKYRQHVENALLNIVKQNTTFQVQKNALKAFLHQHATFVQGTVLDYVAQPELVVTKALVTLAERLAAEDNLPAIQLLMPEVATNSLIDKYPDLSTLPLDQIFKTHNAMSGNFLIPVRCLLDYIQSPDEPLYLPYCYEDYVPTRLKKTDILELFEHSQITHDLHDIFKAHYHLTHNQDNLLGQLQLLGKLLKAYDAHSGLGTQADAAHGTYTAIQNFMHYYLKLKPCYLTVKQSPLDDSDLPEGHHIGYVLSNNTLYFINRHEHTIQSITQPYQETRFGINLVTVNDINNIDFIDKTPTIIRDGHGAFYFLGQPNTTPVPLPKEKINPIALSFSPQPQHIIHLALGNVPDSLYEAIASTGYHSQSLADYLNQTFTVSQTLNEDHLARIEIQTGHSFLSGYTQIPAPLRNEIELLWQLFHNPAKNLEATRNLATCIGTRGEEIRKLTQQYQAALIGIGIHPEQQQKLFQNAKNQLQHQRQLLEDKLENRTYSGKDQHLCLNKLILQTLQHPLRIQNYAELTMLNDFKPQDLTVLLQENRALKVDISGFINTIENFSIYLTQTPAKTLSVILSVLKKYITIWTLNNDVKQLKNLYNLLPEDKIVLLIKTFITQDNALNFALNAAYNGHAAVIQALSAAHADLNQTMDNGITPAHIAAQLGHVTVINALIEAKADLNQAMNYGVTPAYIAAQLGHVTVINALIEAKANLNQATNNGATSTYVAAKYGHVAVVEALAKAGADLNQATNNGETPAFIAAHNGHAAVIQALAAAHADLNQAKNNGATPAHIAAKNGHFAVIQALAAAHADLNQAMNNSATPTCIAVLNGHAAVIEVLAAVDVDFDFDFDFKRPYFFSLKLLQDLASTKSDAIIQNMKKFIAIKLNTRAGEKKTRICCTLQEIACVMEHHDIINIIQNVFQRKGIISTINTLIANISTPANNEKNNKRHRESLSSPGNSEVEILNKIKQVVREYSLLELNENKEKILTLIASVCNQYHHPVSADFFQPEVPLSEFQRLIKDQQLTQNEIYPLPLSQEEINTLEKEPLTPTFISHFISNHKNTQKLR